MTIWNHILFWIAAVLSIITIYKMRLSGGRKEIAAGESVLPEKAYQVAFAVIAFIAVFVRLYRFGAVPGGFNQDGAMAAVDAKALADYGTDRFGMRLPVHLTAWGYGQMSALLSYLMAPFMKLFGFSPLALRLPQLLVSLLGLICLYLFVRRAFGKNEALAVFSFAAINPWHILQSRWALDCNLYPHFFMMGLLFLQLAAEAKRHRLLLSVSMVMFGLCMYCYGVSLYTLPLFLLAACIYLLRAGKISLPDAVLAFFVYLAVAGPFLAVMAINFFRWDTIETPFFTLPYFPDSIRSGSILFFSGHKAAQLAENLRFLLRVTVQQAKDLPWNDVEGFGTMYLFSMPFAFAGLYSLLRECRKRCGAVLALLFLLTGIWCGLTTNQVNVNRLNIIYYPILILTGIGIYEVLRRTALPRMGYGVAAAYAVAFALFAHTYFTGYAAEIRGYFFGDFSGAVSSLKDSPARKLYITADTQYKGSREVSEILTLFWHEIDAEYFQGKTVPQGELPYNEKYTFCRIDDISIDAEEDAAYVITAGDLARFDSGIYHFEQFGAYYTVTLKEASP